MSQFGGSQVGQLIPYTPRPYTLLIGAKTERPAFKRQSIQVAFSSHGTPHLPLQIWLLLRCTWQSAVATETPSRTFNRCPLPILWAKLWGILTLLHVLTIWTTWNSSSDGIYSSAGQGLCGSIPGCRLKEGITDDRSIQVLGGTGIYPTRSTFLGPEYRRCYSVAAER